nr:cysteine--tRNA ligase [Lachnospiraceae bacterium]
LDIHCGGVDNIFPHHTNEIAQSESYLGHKWCNYWFHVNHLNDKNGKMSKSKGDILTVSTLEGKGFNPLVYRMFCLQSHYRKPLEFSYDTLANTASAYEKLRKSTSKIVSEAGNGAVNQGVFDEFKNKFIDALGNDLNTSFALTVLYDMLKADTDNATKAALIKDFDSVLCLDLDKPLPEAEKAAVDPELEKYILERIEARKEAKKNKDFAAADAIRDELAAKGIAIKDTREGTTWEVQ